MNHYRTISCCLLVLSSSLSTQASLAQTPAPMPNVNFALPLTDSSTATAAFLPMPNGQAYLVYATASGKLGLWIVTPIAPNPNPTPIPPPDPTPQRLTIAIVENPATTTQQQRQILADPTWRKLATEKHTFRGIIPTDVIEKGTGKPPASLVPFLDRAKLHNLPWCMFITAAGIIVWEGQLPTSSAELTALIRKHGG